MLPFQIDPPPAVGLSPAEAALRQRQRMLQAGVFVCCLLLLLDTRPPRVLEAPPREVSSKEQKQVRLRARLDEAASATRRPPDRQFANVTGLYQGKCEWTRNGTHGPTTTGGLAVVHVEMMGIEGFRELSVARALVSLTDPATDKSIFVSAFGLYFHPFGRLAMVANIGNPDPTRDLELRWTRVRRRRRRPENSTAGAEEEAPVLFRNRSRSPQQLRGGGARWMRRAERAGTRRHLEERRRLEVLMGPDGETLRKTASVSMEGLVDGYSLELVVAALLPRPSRKPRRSATARSNFTLDRVPPLFRGNESKSPRVYDDDDDDDDGEEEGGSFFLKTERRVAYPLRPLRDDVYRHGRCAFLVDLEEDPTVREKATTTEKQRGTDLLALRLVGTITGCGMDIKLTAEANRIDWDAARRAALGYSLLMTSVCVVQIVLLFRQLHFSRTQAVAARVSLLCVAAQSLIDAVLCVANLLLCAAVQNLFAAFASVAFFELVIFCVVEMRYVVVVFQAHDPQRFWLGASTRRQLAILHAQFYFALFAALCAVYASRDDVRLVTLVAYSFWLPQIVRNARYEYAQPFHDSYLYGMALSRLVAPLYVYAYPYSLVGIIITNAKLRPLFCLLLLAWQALQVAVLKAQTRLGPRFFVPRCFLPARYDYRRPLPPPPRRPRPPLPSSLSQTNATSSDADADADAPLADERGFECVICFQDVMPSARNHLITPCDHVFHDSCLLQWMQFKMECPVCRSTLPPI